MTCPRSPHGVRSPHTVSEVPTTAPPPAVTPPEKASAVPTRCPRSPQGVGCRQNRTGRRLSGRPPGLVPAIGPRRFCGGSRGVRWRAVRPLAPYKLPVVGQTASGTGRTGETPPGAPAELRNTARERSVIPALAVGAPRCGCTAVEGLTPEKQGCPPKIPGATPRFGGLTPRSGGLTPLWRVDSRERGSTSGRGVTGRRRPVRRDAERRGRGVPAYWLLRGVSRGLRRPGGRHRRRRLPRPGRPGGRTARGSRSPGGGRRRR